MLQFAALTWNVKYGLEEEPARRAIRELDELPMELLEVPRDTSSPTAFRGFFLAHSLRCPVPQRQDQRAAAVGEAGADR